MLTIGLFGTCGQSVWRDVFIDRYKVLEIDYFNPQKDDWDPSDAKIEAEHLVNDEIICFPITSETYATGSLAETGFSIIQALKFNDRRDILIMISEKLDDELLKNKELAKESMRGRSLVLEHLKKLNISNVHLVPSLDAMLNLSVFLYHQRVSLAKFKKGLGL